MRGFILTYWLLLSNLLPGQIQVDKAGDGWDLKIDSAIFLIKQVDTVKFNLLSDVCYKIEFWNNTFSSNDGSYGNKGVILVAVKDIKLNSINNLAAVLVHESLHLYVLQKGIAYSPSQEEEYAYRYELEFISRLKNPEPWLFQHAITQLNNIQK
jgi:hypothetical protein